MGVEIVKDAGAPQIPYVKLKLNETHIGFSIFDNLLVKYEAPDPHKLPENIRFIIQSLLNDAYNVGVKQGRANLKLEIQLLNQQLKALLTP